MTILRVSAHLCPMLFDKNPNPGAGRQYAISIAMITAVALACYPVAGIIGYRSVALLLLFALSLLSLRMSLYPMLAAATVSALVWNFFFIPPQFTFHIDSVEDGLMFAMYFIVALLNGVFSARIRRAEELARQKEERANAAKLYDTILPLFSTTIVKEPFFLKIISPRHRLLPPKTAAGTPASPSPRTAHSPAGGRWMGLIEMVQ